MPKRTFISGFTIPDPPDQPEDTEEQPARHCCRRCRDIYVGLAGELCELCAAEEE